MKTIDIITFLEKIDYEKLSSNPDKYEIYKIIIASFAHKIAFLEDEDIKIIIENLIKIINCIREIDEKPKLTFYVNKCKYET